MGKKYQMKLVEIVRTVSTSDETIETVRQFAISLGKTPVLAKDYVRQEERQGLLRLPAELNNPPTLKMRREKIIISLMSF